jgi:plastocyanin
MKIKNNKIVGISVLVLLALVVIPTTTTTAYAQGLPLTRPDINEQTRIVQNLDDGFRFQLPQGWVIEDIDQTKLDPSVDRRLGYSIFAIVCPESQALPAVGGLHNCEEAETSLYIIKDWRLNEKPEFSIYAEGNVSQITIDDYVAYRVQQAGEFGGDVKLVNNTDKAVNVVFTNSPTNETVTTPGKLVEFTYRSDKLILAPEIRAFELLAITNEGGSTIQRWRLLFEDESALLPAGTTPAPVQQIYDTFEILALSPTSSSASSPTTTKQQQEKEEQHQSQQGASMGLTEHLQEDFQRAPFSFPIRIIPDSSSLTANAYHPAPVAISVGDAARWTNEDAQPHTVTSGEGQNATPDGRFDSGIMVPGETFEYTFTEVFPYEASVLLPLIVIHNHRTLFRVLFSHQLGGNSIIPCFPCQDIRK